MTDIQWHSSGLRQRWWVDLLDMRGNLISKLDGATSFTVDYKDGASIKGSGQIGLTLTGPFDWRDKMARIWVEVDDGVTVQSFPLITAFMEVASETRDDTKVTVTIDLVDRATRLDQVIANSTTEVVGAVVTSRIREYFSVFGITSPAITESSETLSTDMYWDAGKTFRNVVDDLIAAIGYRGLWFDVWGNPVVEPYTLPSSRPIAASLIHGPTATFLPKWTSESNASDIINQLVVISTTNGDTPPLIAERFDHDPASPWSTVSRGRAISRIETNVEATSQEVLDGILERLWAESRSVTRSLRMDMRWQPLRLQDRVEIRTGETSWGDSLSTTATVQGFTIKGEAGKPLSNMQLNLREVS